MNFGKSKITKFMLGASALALAGTGISAFAQDAGAAEQDDDTLVQDTIIVTVDRREQSLQDYSGAAAVVDADTLKTLNIDNIKNLDGKIPGLSIANNQGNIEVYIRGVGSSNNTELSDPAAATHWNDVYIPRPSGIGAGFFDIERVEVNLGPQGTIRGRAATGGSVNVIPWKPGLGVFDAGFEVGVGNYNEVTLEGYANIPITDIAALRIAAYDMKHDSYMESVTPDRATLGLDVPTSESDGVGVAEAADDFGIRAALLIQPDDNLSVTLTVDQMKQEGTGYTGVNYANPLGNGINPDDVDPRKVIGRGFTPIEDTNHEGFKAHITYDFDAFTFEYIGSYRDVVYDYEFVTPASGYYDGILDNLGPLDYDNFSRIRFTTDSASTVNEFRLFNSDEDKLFYTLGLFLFEEDQRTFLGTTGDRNPFFQGVEFNQTTFTSEESVYGDFTYTVNDKLRLTAGARYTEIEKDRFGINARYAFGFGGPDFSCCFVNGVAHGTEGFEFAGLDRSIINPDTNSDGQVDGPESLAFFFDGVANFGARDGFDNIFPLVNGVPTQVLNGGNGVFGSDVAPCTGFAFVGSCANGIVPSFDGVVDFSLAPFNSSFALQNGRIEDSFTSWRLKGEYDLTPDNLLYASISKSARVGGFNDNIPVIEGVATNPSQNAPVGFDATGRAPTFDGEELLAYEFGSKNEFLWGDWPVTLNTNVFLYVFKDKIENTLLSVAQVIDREGLPLTDDQRTNLGGQIVSFNFNVGDTKFYGAQVDGSIAFDHNINLNGSFLYLPEANYGDDVEPVQDARYQADVDAGNSVNRDISGNRLIRTPEIQLNGSLSKAWEFDNGGKFDTVLSAGYRSEQFMTIFNGIDYDPNDGEQGVGRLDDKVDGYWTFDLGAGYSFDPEDKRRIEAYVTNLTDVEQEQAIIITQFDNTRFFNRPRTYGVRFRARF